MLKKDKDLKKTISQQKRKIEVLETEKYDLTQEMQILKGQLERKTLEVSRHKKKVHEFSNSITLLGEEMKKYREKHKKERYNLEKLLHKSERIINYFHKSAVILGKSIGKILHHLLIHLDYDMKQLPAKIVNDKVNKIYEWIRSFEKNEYLKKRKLFRKMGDKLNFYKKLEIPVLQNAYNRIHLFLKQNESLAERGEFSILNQTLMGGMSRQNSMLRSMLSRRSFRNDDNSELGFQSNILGELNADLNKPDNLTDLICRFHNCLTNSNLGDLTPVTLQDFLKKFKNVVSNIEDQIKGINVKEKQNKVEAIESILQQTEANHISNYQFHMDCLNEFQTKLKQIENRFKIIELVLEGRNVSEEDRQNMKLNEILANNQKLNEDDFDLNINQKSNIDLVNMLEGYFKEKTKIFSLKKQFMEYIENLKKEDQTKLTGLFDELNNIEDQYSVSQQAIMNLRNAIMLNKKEVNNIKNKIKLIASEKIESEKENKRYEQELEECQQKIKLFEDQRGVYIKDNGSKQNELEILHKNLQQTHEEFLKSKINFIENEEKRIYIEELLNKLTKENIQIVKQNEDNKKMIKEKHAELSQLMERLQDTDKDSSDLQFIINVIEGKPVTKECLCNMSDSNLEILKKFIVFLKKNDTKKFNYDYLINMIKDLVNDKDSGFDKFIKLTITSQMSTNEKVKKINTSIGEKNDQILTYVNNLIHKNVLESFEIISLFAINLKKLDQESFTQQINQFKINYQKLKKDQSDDIGIEKIINLSRFFKNFKKSLE